MQSLRANLKKDTNTIEGSSQIQRETGREVFAVFAIPQALVFHLESLLCNSAVSFCSQDRGKFVHVFY